jgi:hypothetical protein
MEPVVQRVLGDIAAAVAETLRVAFIEDGKLVITERGPAICSVVDVLTTYLGEHSEHPRLMKWVKMISDAARKLVRHSTGLLVAGSANKYDSYQALNLRSTTWSCRTLTPNSRERPSKFQEGCGWYKTKFTLSTGIFNFYF